MPIHFSSRLLGSSVRLWVTLACDNSLRQYRLYLLAAARLWKSANNSKVCWFNWIVVYLHRWEKSSGPIFSRVTLRPLSFKVSNMGHLKSDEFPWIFSREAPLN